MKYSLSTKIWLAAILLTASAIGLFFQNGSFSSITSFLFHTEEELTQSVAGHTKKHQSKQVFYPSTELHLEVPGAVLDIPAGALTAETFISLETLIPAELPPMDADLVNVTWDGGGFRCLPHGTVFQKPAIFQMEFDTCLIPEGYSAKDVRTFYFDEDARRWRSIPKDSLLASGSCLISQTNHFTDFINGILKVPDAPETMASVKTSIDELKAANPSANIELMAPPMANAMGNATLQLPIKLPAGRQGMMPQLAVSYNNEGGTGWLGLGWDLSVPSISIETRWGVPRYDTDFETETYLFGGGQLAPVTHRADWEPRSTGDKTFHPRVEGSFQKIVRHGNSPKDYWWEVTQKDGTKSIYGGDDNAVLKDNNGNIAQWMLRETRDLNNNFVKYHYLTQEDVGITGGTVEGRQIYISEITYTGHGTEEGKYRVEFLRDQQIPGEPRRPDVQISGRLGLKQVTADLLRKINITYAGQPVRSYELLYETGAFYKTLLSLIVEYDRASKELARHSFEYFDEVRDADGKYQPFQLGDSTWNAGNDDIKAKFLGLIEDDISALGGSESSNYGFGLIVTLGIGFDPSTKSFSVGGGGSYGRGSSTGRIAMVDIDGDRLPDKVFKIGSELYFRKNLSGATIGSSAFSSPQMIATVSDFSRSKSRTINWNVQANAGVSYGPVSAGVYYAKSWTNTKTTTDVYLLDYNGDGLIDVASRGKVLFNHLVNGVPTFDDDPNLTPNPIVPGAALDTTLVNFDPAEQDTLIDLFPLSDVVRVWRPPFNGRVKLDAPVRLTNLPQAADYDLKDGVRVAIQFNGNELNSMLINTADFSEKILISPNQEFDVDTLDHFYFRVQSRFDGAFDRVIWQPKFTYTEIGDLTNAGMEREVNGQNVFEYQSAQDFVVTGFQSINMPYKGKIQVSGNFQKPKTTDDVELQMVKLIDNQPPQVLFSKKYLASDEVDEDTVFFQYVEFKDPLSFRIKTHTNVDWTSLKWMPNLQLVEAVDSAGAPVPDIINPATGISYYNFCPAVNFSMFNHAFNKTPVWAADGDGTLTLSAQVYNSPLLSSDTAQIDSITFSVKKIGALLGQTTFKVRMDSLLFTPNLTLQFPVQAGDSIFVEFHIPNRTLADKLFQNNILSIVPGDGPSEAGVFSVLSENEFIFGALHRGWGGFAYNGNRDRATQPIDEDELNLDEAKMNQMSQTQIEDIDNPDQLDGAYDPSRANFTMLFPDTKVGAWRSSDEFVYLRGDTLSSSRLGEDDILLLPPTAGAANQFYAPAQVSVSKIKSWNGGFTVTLPIPLNKSSSDNVTNSEIQVFDGDGDGNADFFNKGKAQFSRPYGGLMPNVHQIGFENMTSLAHSEGGTTGGSPVIAAVNAAIAAYGVGSAKKKEQAIAAISGFSMNSVNVTIPNIANVNFNESYNENFDYTKYSWLDVNGDGLPDWVKNDGTVALNLGRSFAPFEQWQHDFVRAGKSTDEGLGGGVSWGNLSWAFGVSRSETKTEVEKALQDVNGDGLLDMVFLGDPITVRLNTGCGFAPFDIPWHGVNFIEKNSSIGTSLNGAFTYCFIIPIPFAPLKICINPSGNYGGGASRQVAQMVDMNGDGFPDLAFSNDANDLRARLSTIGKTNLLKTVHRPLGGSFSVDYKRMGNTYEMAQSKWVLSKVEVLDGLDGDGPTRTASIFEYTNGQYNRRERDFYGFEKVTTTQLDTENGDQPYRIREQAFLNKNIYEKGLLVSETLRDAAGNIFTETKNTYEFRKLDGSQHPDPSSDDAGIVFPALLKTENLFYEGQSNAGQAMTTEMDYDLLGNIYVYKNTGDGSQEDLLTASIAYHNNPNLYIHSVAKSITVLAGGQLIRSRESDMDAAGNITEIRQFLENNTVARHSMAYDDFGNLSKITRPENYKGERMWYQFEYDQDLHTYVVRTTDAYGYESLAKYDPVFGLIIEATDINGERLAYTYDDAARLASVTSPYELASGQPYTMRFEYFPDAPVPYAKTFHYDPETGGDIVTITFMDGLQRPVQVKKTGVIWNGTSEEIKWIVSGRTIFDAFGRTVKTYYPTLEDSGTGETFKIDFDDVAPIRTNFDVLDRPLSTILPDSSITAIAYGFGMDNVGLNHFQTTITDALDNTTTKYTDLRQRQRALRNSDDIWTNFRYNAIGELLDITDHEGNKTFYQYDWLGRKLMISHPDFDTILFKYDLASNKIFEQNAKIREEANDTAYIRYDYEFERLTEINFPIHFQNQVKLHYGKPGDQFGRVGRIWLEEDASGGQEYFYGRFGEVIKTIRTMLISVDNVQTFVFEEERDSWGRIQKMFYPDGEVVEYEYNEAGKLRRMFGQKFGTSYDYIKQLGFNKFEQRTYCELGNGTRTAYTYESDRRRLSNLNVSLPDDKVILDNNYTYDSMDNVKRVTNAATPQVLVIGGPASYNYEYDKLYRLTNATGTWTGHNRKESFSLQMEYDDLHNIISKKQEHQTNGSVANQGTIDFDYEISSSRPHLATKIGNRTFTYDANGNTTGWTSENHFSWRRMAWNEVNQLVAVSDNGFNSGYTYDWRGERAMKSTGGTQNVSVNGEIVGFKQHRENWTAYVSPQMVVRAGQFTKHYFVGEQRVASKVGGGGYFKNRSQFNKTLTAGNLDYAEKAIELEKAKQAYWLDNPGDKFPIPVINVADSTYSIPPPQWDLMIGPPPLTGPPYAPVWYTPPVTNETVRAGYLFEPSKDSTKLEDNQYYFHPDHLGSTSYVTDRIGALREHIEYFPSGEIFVEEHTSAGGQQYRFTGKEMDAETGLYYFGARYYDPIAGLWLSADPMFEKYPGWSPYNYCSLNPIKRIDPDGREDEELYTKIQSQEVKEKWNKLNDREKSIGILNPSKLQRIGNNAKKASDKTKEIFGDNGRNDKSDAFRHAYWSALNTAEMGEDFARSFSDAHEYSTPSGDINTELFMDIHNNDVGIETAKSYPEATPEQLQNIILKKIEGGELIILKGNKLQSSDGRGDPQKIRRKEVSERIGLEIQGKFPTYNYHSPKNRW